MGENDAKGVLGGVVAFFFGGEGRLSLMTTFTQTTIAM